MKTTLETQTITRTELKSLLMNVNTPMFISMVTRTPVKMRKTGNIYSDEGIFNTSEKYRIVTGFDYENSVNGRREKEGKEKDFKSGQGKPSWFNVISKGLVTDKKTGEKFYLRYQYHPTSTLKTDYTYKNDPIGKEMFESFMYQRSDYSNQGLDNPLRFQVCDLRNILEISICGVHYILND